MGLFAGAFGAVRNPLGHDHVEWSDPAEAAEMVLLADSLIRQLDRVSAVEPCCRMRSPARASDLPGHHRELSGPQAVVVGAYRRAARLHERQRHRTRCEPNARSASNILLTAALAARTLRVSLPPSRTLETHSRRRLGGGLERRFERPERGHQVKMRSDSQRPSSTCTITPYRDGPLIVRGPVRLQDMHGREIVVERDPVALCRCGHSRIRPLCDGTHKLSRFKAPSEREDGRASEGARAGSG